MLRKYWAQVEPLLNFVVVLATVVVAGTVVYGQFFERNPSPIDARPKRVSDWEPPDSLTYEFGSGDAVVQMVVIEDPECPVCKAFHSELQSLPDSIMRHLRVRRVLVGLSYHTNAPMAIRHLECSASLAEFDRLLSVVYSKQDSLGKVQWSRLVSDAGISQPNIVSECVANHPEPMRADLAWDYALSVGSSGTPTVLVNGWRLPYPPPAFQLRAIVMAIRAGENPFSRSEWRKIRLPRIDVPR